MTEQNADPVSPAQALDRCAKDVIRLSQATIPETVSEDSWTVIRRLVLMALESVQTAERLRSPSRVTPEQEIWCAEVNRKDNPALEGCTGQGRPSCTATECFYGIETCPICRKAKAIGAACGFVHVAASRVTPTPETGEQP